MIYNSAKNLFSNRNWSIFLCRPSKYIQKYIKIVLLPNGILLIDNAAKKIFGTEIGQKFCTHPQNTFGSI
jgi:hypothetical protein